MKLVFSLIGLAVLCACTWFAWAWFLDPSGKVAWQWNANLTTQKLLYLRKDARGINLKYRDEVTVIAPRTPTGTRSSAAPRAAAPSARNASCPIR